MKFLWNIHPFSGRCVDVFFLWKKVEIFYVADDFINKVLYIIRERLPCMRGAVKTLNFR